MRDIRNEQSNSNSCHKAPEHAINVLVACRLVWRCALVVQLRPNHGGNAPNNVKHGEQQKNRVFHNPDTLIARIMFMNGEVKEMKSGSGSFNRRKGS